MGFKDTAAGLIMGGICILFVVIVLGVMGYVSLKEHEHMVEKGTGLPDGATQIEEAGAGWLEFTYKGQRFLYRRYSFSDRKSECIVRIDEPDDRTSR